MLKPIEPKFRPDLSARLRDIAEKQIPAKLKPIVGVYWRFLTAKPCHFIANWTKKLADKLFSKKKIEKAACICFSAPA